MERFAERICRRPFHSGCVAFASYATWSSSTRPFFSSSPIHAKWNRFVVCTLEKRCFQFRSLFCCSDAWRRRDENGAVKSHSITEKIEVHRPEYRRTHIGSQDSFKRMHSTSKIFNDRIHSISIDIIVLHSAKDWTSWTLLLLYEFLFLQSFFLPRFVFRRAMRSLNLASLVILPTFKLCTCVHMRFFSIVSIIPSQHVANLAENFDMKLILLIVN